MTIARFLALPMVLTLAACGGADDGAQDERKTAAGEVLGGTISDDMLPLDTVTSQNPPVRESSSERDEAEPAASGSEGDDEEAGADGPASEPAETPGTAPAEPEG